ncbi:response regulator receiver domain protein [Calothrix sp. NIES-4101]|nr:response regulator receiver domain protein [Calothrix sp. NIES-4101]
MSINIIPSPLSPLSPSSSSGQNFSNYLSSLRVLLDSVIKFTEKAHVNTESKIYKLVTFPRIYYPPININIGYSGVIHSLLRRSRHLNLNYLLEQTVVASNKILVIDDTTVVRVKVREMLPPGNFQVLEAKDGIEGLKLIQQEKFSLIMLDFLLPKMSGWEVFQQIQAQADLRKTPLVIMSGRKEEVTEKISEPFEYFEFLGKPFDQKQLISAIKAAMAKAKQPRQEISQITASTSGASNGVEGSTSSAEIQALNDKVVKMQTEIDSLKKQLAQVVTFIKQKIK